MIYKYNKEQLVFQKLPIIRITLLIFMVIVLSSSILSKTSIKTEYIPEETKMLILKENNKFSEDRLKEYVNSLNMKFPHIVIAQSKLESNNYSSTIFKANNNLFGMKEARIRPTTNKGTNLGHAVFDNWKDSVLDYAFFQAAYMKEIKTEDEYYSYLGVNYAEDTNYVKKVKEIVAQEEINN